MKTKEQIENEIVALEARREELNNALKEATHKYQFNIGDTVEIVNRGKIYPHHADRRRLGIYLDPTPVLPNGTVATVFNRGLINEGTEVVCIRTDKGEESLIGITGVKSMDREVELEALEGNWVFVKSLEHEKIALIYYVGNEPTYGFDFGGNWTPLFETVAGFTEPVNSKFYRVWNASSGWAIEKLKEEAERRGLVQGVTIRNLDDGDEFVMAKEKHPYQEDLIENRNQLWVYGKNGLGHCIFDNGDWAEIVKVELETKPKVGDVCKFQHNDNPNFTVGILEEIDEDGDFWCLSGCYTVANKLTKEEVIELLFGDKG